MPPKAKQNVGKKTQEKKKNGIVEDKTFGLKNKNKSKVVQKFVKNVERTIKQTDASEKRKEEKKQAKILRIQQEQELKALFSEALTINVKKSDLKKKKAAEGGAAASAAGGAKASDHYDDAWAEAELAKAGLEGPTSGADPSMLTLEQRIEQQRDEMRKNGQKGTPVTAETFEAWKRRKAEKALAAREALVKAESLKKKGGKGLSILSGKDLFSIDASLFVDDDEATDDVVFYERRDDEEDEEDADKKSSEEETSEGHKEAAPNVVGDASLYLEGDDDLDDLDDLDDDD